MPQTTNKEMLAIVASGLKELLNEVVFVGGATTELFTTDNSMVADVRQTDDIDCIIEIASRREYAELEVQLRQLKFENDQKVICRWKYKGIIVDIMPTNSEILGFSNRWYKEGILHAVKYKLLDKVEINVISLPYFLACKLEALFDRGIKDLRLSKDLEDIVFILNYNQNLFQVLANCNQEMKKYLSNQFQKLLQFAEIEEAVFCVLPAGENNVENVTFIVEQMDSLKKI